MQQRHYGIEGDRHAALLRDAARMRLIDATATAAGQGVTFSGQAIIGRIWAWTNRFLADARASLHVGRPASTAASLTPAKRIVSAGSQHDVSR